jgi:hypothetical protein
VTVADDIDALDSDAARAQFCRDRAEDYRRQWFAGQARTIAEVIELAQVGDKRFRAMSGRELDVTGRQRWSRSQEGQDLRVYEDRFAGLSLFYLAWADYRRV